MYPRILVIALASSVLCGIPRLIAQDVTVTPLEWVDAKDAPDELPVEKHALRIQFPPDLSNTPDPGYVLVKVITSDRGEHLSLWNLATQIPYEKAVSYALRNWSLKPGRRAGKPVNTFTQKLIIFNPASADVSRPDATPRLLFARPVVDASRKIGKNTPAFPPEVVWATVSLDATGGPTGLKDEPPALAELLEKAVHAWRFAPARRAGVAIPSELRVPFIIVSPTEGMMDTGNATLPRVLRQIPPTYPLAMRQSGLRGEVLVDFVVDIEGRVTRAFVVRSLNPAFDEPALDAVDQWTFEPGRKDGVPVKTHMRVPVFFQLQGEWEGGGAGVTVDQKADQSDLPPEFRYDIAAKLRGRVLPVYPYEQLNNTAKGEATVRLVISETGKVIYVNLIKATNPEFGGATIAMIEQWEFEPAIRAGRPTRSILDFTQEFSPYDQELVTDETDRMRTLERKHPERIVSAGKLDVRLRPTSARPPVFPSSLDGSVTKGEATVELLIDEDGRARLPRVVSASAPAFGWAAVQAVSTWRFDPPRQAGGPVVTRVRIPFIFSAVINAPAELKK